MAWMGSQRLQRCVNGKTVKKIRVHKFFQIGKGLEDTLSHVKGYQNMT